MVTRNMDQGTDTNHIKTGEDHGSTDLPALQGRILIVDDDSDVLFTLGTVLKDAGYVVNSYNNPTKALKDYAPETYDLLILDVKMPEINGFDLYKQIKTMDQKAKVCFLTAGETYYTEFTRLFPELSESNYMLKPVENQQLLKRTLRIIRSESQET